MWLTRRGYVAVAVVVLAVGMAWLAGPRALNALAAPILVALVAGVVQLRMADAPIVERTEPRRGFPGERRTVELRVEGGGVARIEDALSAGLDGLGVGEGTLPTTVDYEVTLRARGEQRLGPVTVRVRDALGLVEATQEVEDTTTLLVYPSVSVVDGAGFFARTMGPETEDRTEFDRLREYAPGDSLRDIHWKSSAKRDDLYVTEYTDPVDEGAVRIAAEADSAATATLVVGAIRAGLAVEVAVPDGTLGRGYGGAHQRHALEVLARTGAGAVRDAEEADVVVTADADGARVTTSDGVRGMDALRLRGENPLVAREGLA